jgi:hypothetical protein
MSDMSSVDERHPHHHVDTLFNLLFRRWFCAGDDGFGTYHDHACCTYKRWCYASELYWECQEVGLEDAEGG